MSQVCIREANLCDLSKMYKLFGLKPVALFSRPQLIHVVEDINGHIVAYVHCEIQEEISEGAIHSLAVLPTHQRRGIATKLVIASQNDMEQMFGSEYVSVHVRKSNHAAFNLFKETLGYKIHGLEAKFYADDGEDAYEMRKQLKGKQMHSGETKGNAKAT